MDLWERKPQGAPRKFPTPESLLDAVVEYFEWCKDNPPTGADLRAMTTAGLCIHVGIDSSTWRSWRNPDDPIHRADLIPIIRWAEDVMLEQKFTGAASGLFNANLISRDLGLVDKASVEGAIAVKGIEMTFASPPEKTSDE